MRIRVRVLLMLVSTISQIISSCSISIQSVESSRYRVEITYFNSGSVGAYGIAIDVQEKVGQKRDFRLAFASEDDSAYARFLNEDIVCVSGLKLPSDDASHLTLIADLSNKSLKQFSTSSSGPAFANDTIRADDNSQSQTNTFLYRSKSREGVWYLFCFSHKGNSWPEVIAFLGAVDVAIRHGQSADSLTATVEWSKTESKSDFVVYRPQFVDPSHMQVDLEKH